MCTSFKLHCTDITWQSHVTSHLTHDTWSCHRSSTFRLESHHTVRDESGTCQSRSSQLFSTHLSVYTVAGLLATGSVNACTQMHWMMLNLTVISICGCTSTSSSMMRIISSTRYSLITPLVFASLCIECNIKKVIQYSIIYVISPIFINFHEIFLHEILKKICQHHRCFHLLNYAISKA